MDRSVEMSQKFRLILQDPSPLTSGPTQKGAFTNPEVRRRRRKRKRARAVPSDNSPRPGRRSSGSACRSTVRLGPRSAIHIHRAPIRARPQRGSIARSSSSQSNPAPAVVVLTGGSGGCVRRGRAQPTVPWAPGAASVDQLRGGDGRVSATERGASSSLTQFGPLAAVSGRSGHACRTFTGAASLPSPTTTVLLRPREPQGTTLSRSLLLAERAARCFALGRGNEQQRGDSLSLEQRALEVQAGKTTARFISRLSVFTNRKSAAVRKLLVEGARMMSLSAAFERPTNGFEKVIVYCA